MKTVLTNGKIYMERGALCEALLIEDGIIRMTGTNEEVLAAGSDSAAVIDCAGRTVVPGFNDTHMHLLQFSEFIAGVRSEDATSINMLVERCRDFMADHPDRVAHGMHAMGWNQDLFTDEKRMPNRHDLDRISTDIPIVLERVCGHIASGNTKAVDMLLAQNGGQVPVIEDGEIELEDDGYPTGIFKEGAVGKCMYIMYAGKVGIYGGETKLTEYEDVGFFGEMGLLSDDARSATAVVEADGTLLEAVFAEDMESIFRKCPAKIDMILRHLSYRLRKLNSDFLAACKEITENYQ